jgi:hypothetical protein
MSYKAEFDILLVPSSNRRTVQRMPLNHTLERAPAFLAVFNPGLAAVTAMAKRGEAVERGERFAALVDRHRMVNLFRDLTPPGRMAEFAKRRIVELYQSQSLPRPGTVGSSRR